MFRDLNRADAASGLRHEAFFYSGDEALLSAVTSFVEEGIARSESTLVALSQPKLAGLTRRLGSQNSTVSFVDMGQMGANPGLIISVWQDFVVKHRPGGPGLRGIGEPITHQRTGAGLVESHHHESMLNLAFKDVDRFSLLCPYDLNALTSDVIERAGTTHPYLNREGVSSASQTFEFSHLSDSVLADPLSEVPSTAQLFEFTKAELGAMRSWLSIRALETGLAVARAQDLILAAHEVASNSVIHGGGGGRLQVWIDDSSLICQITDHGSISDPLLGRLPPASERASGRGLWLANNLCDLVQIRSANGETMIRLHKSVP